MASTKRQRRAGGKDAFPIEKLPDSLLGAVLSFLPTPERARHGPLVSRRWAQLLGQPGPAWAALSIVLPVGGGSQPQPRVQATLDQLARIGRATSSLDLKTQSSAFTGTIPTIPCAIIASLPQLTRCRLGKLRILAHQAALAEALLQHQHLRELEVCLDGWSPYSIQRLGQGRAAPLARLELRLELDATSEDVLGDLRASCSFADVPSLALACVFYWRSVWRPDAPKEAWAPLTLPGTLCAVRNLVSLCLHVQGVEAAIPPGSLPALTSLEVWCGTWQSLCPSLEGLLEGGALRELSVGVASGKIELLPGMSRLTKLSLVHLGRRGPHAEVQGVSSRRRTKGLLMPHLTSLVLQDCDEVCPQAYWRSCTRLAFLCLTRLNTERCALLAALPKLAGLRAFMLDWPGYMYRDYLGTVALSGHLGLQSFDLRIRGELDGFGWPLDGNGWRQHNPRKPYHFQTGSFKWYVDRRTPKGATVTLRVDRGDLFGRWAPGEERVLLRAGQPIPAAELEWSGVDIAAQPAKELKPRGWLG